MIIAGLLLTAPALATDATPVAKFDGWTGPKPAKPPCECRHKGGKVMLGEKRCMKRGDQLVTMQCSLVLNNTAWKRVEDSCDLAMN